MELSVSNAAQGRRGAGNLSEAGLRKPFTISLNALPMSNRWRRDGDLCFMPITVGKVEAAALYKRP
jgi:hypothetical protein